jgi:hypothetical protein
MINLDLTAAQKLNTLHFLIMRNTTVSVGRDSSVGTATRYRAGRSGDRIPVLGARFSAPVQTGPLRGTLSFLYNGYRVSSPGVKRPGRGADHPPYSSEVK